MWIRRIALLLFFLVVLAGIGVAFAGAMLYDFFVVPTPAMEPTLHSGDRLLIRPLEEDQVRPGALVVFRSPDADGVMGTLRIVATAGDTVGTEDGELTIDGDPADEDYLDDDVSTTGIDEVRVPKDYVFLLGDNRGASTDSRVFGPVPVDQLTG